MTSEANIHNYVAIRNTALHHKWLRDCLWYIGGQYSYFYTETDPGDERDIIDATRVQADEPTKRCILGPALSLDHDQSLPQNLSEAIDALARVYPLNENDTKTREKLETKAFGKGWSAEALELREKRLEFQVILRDGPKDLGNLLAAWAKEERDDIYYNLEESTPLPSAARRYFSSSIKNTRAQEQNWKEGVSKSGLKGVRYYVWFLIGLPNVVALDIISFNIDSVLAALRGVPLRALTFINILSILDYQFSDERLIRSYLMTNGFGTLPAMAFGAMKAASPDRYGNALNTVTTFLWKATLCSVWQIAMHNPKNIRNFLYSILVKRQKIQGQRKQDLLTHQRALKQKNAYLFAWLDTWKPSSRCRQQLSLYKRDQEDAVNVLGWIVGEDDTPNTDVADKLPIFLLAIILGAAVVGSTVPIDKFAGLLMVTFAVPFCLRVANDVLKGSQSYQDLEDLLARTTAPTTPSTIAYLVNVFYWLSTGNPLFPSFKSPAFICGFVIVFVTTLYVRLWIRAFSRFCQGIKRALQKLKPKSRDTGNSEV
ncbi:hypothetical protein PFICI_13863 [Pestalotiopsis fici W106-1]|uniref:Uncharacterized protein n=1 Tax=Pestalotiopsis fici (strain W106-1 / CGMCC3.15140) TaxID=1229662 RepID=W3WLF0_PESFW|nr:uncharacterized protein PFICI_13863 [Pestalotiopsis fici W106-1]ETS73997.1 hypothetical protein PFICI_13863 [Pestalotiopsis fici W106-1]